ncbi:uncharacterized protein METZ01_LOCUS481002, partial [marine metagenome]
VAGCSGFQFAPDYPIIDSDQLTCSPADSRLCSGWKI